MFCQFCHTEMVNMGPDELDQCGWTYLPAIRWECPLCCEAGTCTHCIVKTGEQYRPRELPGSGRRE